MAGPEDPTATEQVNERVVACEWIEGNPKYYPTGISKKHVLFYGLYAEGITKNEGLKIMLSLRYLKK